MQVTIYWIAHINSGRIGIIPRPRGGDWLEDEICSLRESGVDVVVSLLEKEEVVELDLKNEHILCETKGIIYISFPIPDRNVPSSRLETQRLIDTLLGLLSEGKHLVIHCRQGVGRSAMIAACLLAKTGVGVDEAFEQIAVTRGCSVPDTQEQHNWVARFIDSF